MLFSLRQCLMLLLMLLMTPSSQASWIQICAADLGSSMVSMATMTATDGTQRNLGLVQEKSPDCRSVAFPLTPHAVTAIYPVGAALLAPNVQEVQVTDEVRAGKSSIVAVRSGTADKARDFRERHPVSLGDNLLPTLTERVYGVEERVQVSRIAGGLLVQCAAGRWAAGLALRSPWYLPKAELLLRIQGQGRGTFAVNLTDTNSRKIDDVAAKLGAFNAGARGGVFPLPNEGLNRQEWDSLTLECPLHQAEFVLESVILEARLYSVPTRSTWVWDAQQWQETPLKVFMHAAQHGIGLVHVTVPVHKGVVQQRERLASFARVASQRGLKVWAVVGDPRMVMPGEHAAAVDRVRAYLKYNAEVDAEAAIRGVQFDVEPYLLPEYETAPAVWDQQYLALAKAVHKAVQYLPLEWAVPVWWSDKPELLQALAPFTSGLNVMNYQTDMQKIYRSAVPFLDWATAHEKYVKIALEAGPVSSQRTSRYKRAIKGRLWLVPMADFAIIIFLDTPHTNPYGHAFELTGVDIDDGHTVTFKGREDQLRKLIPELESRFSAWHGFAGIALHEFFP